MKIWKRNPIVYLDMDGVMAESRGLEKLYGVKHWKELTLTEPKDLKSEVIKKLQAQTS